MRKVNVSEVIGKSKLNKFHISVFLVSLFVIVFNGYDQSIYGIALPTLMADTGIAPSVFGLIGSYTLYGMLAGSIVFGMLSDRIGRPKALAIGVLLFCFGTGMFGFANSVTEFAIYRVIAGIGLAGVVPVAIPIVSEYSPIKNRPTLTTYVTLGVPIGAIVTPLIGMALLPKIGWRPMYLSGFMPLIMIILIFVLIPESMERLGRKEKNSAIKGVLQKAAPEFQAEDNDTYITDSQKVGKEKSSLKDLFRDGRARNTILFWITFVCTMFFTYGMQTWLPNMMIRAGFPIKNSMIFMFVYASGALPSIGFSGVLASKIGYKKVIAMYTSLSAVMLALMSFSPPTALMYIMLFLVGAGMFGATGLFYTYIAVSYTNSVRSTGVGFAAAAGRLGGSFGPLVGGFLASSGTTLTTNFMVFAASMAVATICVLFTKERVAL
jgi:AAHS family benzoate transporter-like MFS transporter